MRRIPVLLVFLSIGVPSIYVTSIGALHAQSGVQGPVEAFTFDLPSSSIRAVFGSLGSTTFGPATVKNLSFGSVAPGKDYGIAFRDEHCLVITGLGSGPGSTSELVGVSAPEGVVWSWDGSVAVLYSRTGSWIQVVKGLPASPEATPSLSVASLSGSLLSVAADRTGERLVLGVDGQSAGVYQLAESNFIPLLRSVSSPISLTFSDDGQTLYALDGVSRQISELNWADRSSLAWPAGILEDPIAIRFLRDAAKTPMIYVAGRADRVLLVYDALSREVTASVSLTTTPTRIEPLGHGSFVLGSRANLDDPLWSFRASAQPAVFFVPATPVPASEDRQ